MKLCLFICVFNADTSAASSFAQQERVTVWPEERAGKVLLDEIQNRRIGVPL